MVKLSSWLRPLATLPVGLFITFSQAHGPDIGLLSFMAFALVFGVGSLVFAKENRSWVPLGIVSLVALVLAGVAITQVEDLLLGLYLSVVGFWATVVAIYDLYLARKAGFAERAGRDYLISSVLTFGLALLFLVANLDSVSAVGFFGAYMILVGVHWGIAAAGPKTK